MSRLEARRIVIVVGSMGAGGAERVAATLANAWAAQGRHVWLVASFLGSRKTAYELHPGVSRIFLSDLTSHRRRWPTVPRKLLSLRRTIREIQPDIVVSLLTNVNVLVLAALAGLGIPVVISERTDPSAHIELSRTLKLARALLYRRADALVVQTETARVAYGRLVPELPLTVVIPNPLPAELAASTIRAEHDARGGCVIAMGRLTGHKNYAALIDAFAKAFADDDSWGLQIWGGGPLRADLQRQIDALRLTARVQMCGETEQPWKVLAAAQIFALTSWFEGFPNVMMESMALGLSCIAFDCPSGPRHLADGGSAAVIVPAADVAALAAGLRRLADSPLGRRELGGRAAVYVREAFAESAVLKAWDDLLTAVIVNHRQRSSRNGLRRHASG